MDYILISACTGDLVPGVELSDPECPVDPRALPAAALAWAHAQGYSVDDPDGFETFAVSL